MQKRKILLKLILRFFDKICYHNYYYKDNNKIYFVYDNVKFRYLQLIKTM